MTPDQFEQAIKQGVGVLFGVVCLYLMFRSERSHAAELKALAERHEKEITAVNARLEAMLTRQLDATERGIEAMGSMERSIEGMNELKALNDKIDELRGGRLRR